MSDEDSFVKALRDIDGVDVPPMHCHGHFHRMNIHGFVCRRVIDGRIVWRLTEEGRARAYPQRGRNKVSLERVQSALNHEGSFNTSRWFYKTKVALAGHRALWYTPDYAKEIPR